MAEAAAGILYAARTVVESAALAAKGIYDPTLPLKAHLTPLTSIPVPKAHHTVSVIKGRAYLFGGHSSGNQLADNDVHVVVLPTSAMESADYRRIASGDGAPGPRAGHAAAVIEDRIFVFGGTGEDGAPLNEGGRVWVFDTASNSWSHYDPPPEGDNHAPRASCAAVATEHPRPASKRTDEGALPQQPPDPATIVPEPAAPDSYGTLVVQGGQGADGQVLNDLWAFDVSTRAWAQLPEPPAPPASPAPSLSLVGNRLYSFALGSTSYLDLTPASFDDRGGKGELGIAPLGPWSAIASPSVQTEDAAPETASPVSPTTPGPRTAAPMVPVTTGQGRNYLLLLGGQPTDSQTPCQDIHALQLKPEGMTAASFKDAARQAIKKDTFEAAWSEVQYYDSEGVMVQEGQEGRGIGVRGGLAAGLADGVDGGSVLVWGGVGEDGRVRGDGVLVAVDR